MTSKQFARSTRALVLAGYSSLELSPSPPPTYTHTPITVMGWAATETITGGGDESIPKSIPKTDSNIKTEEPH